MTVCGGWSMVAQENGIRRHITLWCRSWSCTDCAPKRRRSLIRLAKSGQPTKFLTLTIKDRDATPADQALLLSNAFRNLIKRWRRHKPNSQIEFCAVFEPHPSSGRPHLHVIMRAPYTRQEWISRQMADLLDSPIVDIRAITDRRKVAYYIAKYVTKSNIRFGTAKRYWTSKLYDLTKKTRKAAEDFPWPKWQVVKEPLWSLAEQMGNLGFAVRWITEHEFWHLPGERLKPG